MRQLVIIALVLGLMVGTGYAQTMTTDDIVYVQAIRAIKDLKKQIQVKEIERQDALNVVKTQYKTDIQALRQQLKTLAQSIGLTLGDVED